MNSKNLVGGFFLAALLGASAAQAHEKTVPAADVPAPVKKAALERYPGSTATSFATEKEHGKNTYEAKLDLQGGRKVEVVFAADGTFLTEEQVIAVTDLPQPVQDAVTKAGGKVLRVEKAQDAGKPPKYEVLLEKSGKKSELVYDADGKLVKHEKPEAD